MRKLADCWSKDTTPEIARLPDIWMEQYDMHAQTRP